jgi:malonate decarboxylase gamma subunit
MAKRDELLGLNEFLAHLAKCLIYADILAHHRPALGRAAGAFLATALATRALRAARPTRS